MEVRQRKVKNILYVLMGLVVLWVLYLATSYYLDIKAYKELQIDSIRKLSVPSREDHYKWRSDSPYTVVVYFSMDCPHCVELFRIENNYKESHSHAFNLVHRHFPLQHREPLAVKKAVVAECVYNQKGDSGMFSFMSEMYSNYAKTKTDIVLVENIASTYVEDRELFKQCLKDENVFTKINDIKYEAQRQGVGGTPTFGVFKDGVLIARFDTVGEHVGVRIMDAIKEVFEK